MIVGIVIGLILGAAVMFALIAKIYIDTIYR